MRIVKQFLSCGLVGVIFGVVFLRIENSVFGFIIGSSMGLIFIWFLYIIAYLLNLLIIVFFRKWSFVFPSNIRLPYGFLVINGKNTKARIFFISVIENCGVELTKNIERDQ